MYMKMNKILLLKLSKETNRKLRWSTYVGEDNTKFELYIPKWRVPEPWPKCIRVIIQAFNSDPFQFVPSPYNPPESNIRVIVWPDKNFTHTWNSGRDLYSRVRPVVHR